jgi:hypothetical protein
MKYLDSSLKNSNKIYRYIPVYRLLEILSLNKLALMKTNMWEDPFEGFLYDYCVSNFSQWERFSNLKTTVFCLCFSSDSEKDQIWRSYTPIRDGVRMKMDLAALESSFGEEYILGKAHYKTVNNIKRLLFKYRDDAKPSKEKLLRLFFFKRKAFKNDMEVRLITADSLITGDVKSIDVDAKGMIREVMFDPRIDDGLYPSYRSLLKSKSCDF